MADQAEDGSDGEADGLFADVREEVVFPDAGSEEQRAQSGGDTQDDDCEGASALVLPDPGEPTASQVEDHRA